MKGILFLINGAMGVGKTTVVDALLADSRRGVQLQRSVSVTTHAPRPGETPGKDYHFITLAEYDALRKNNGLLEYDDEVSSACYGTRRSPLVEDLADGFSHVAIINTRGLRQIKARADEVRLVSIFLKAPSPEALRERFLRRGTETPAAIERRLEAGERETATANEYDYVLVNTHVPATVEMLQTIMRAETLRSYRNPIERMHVR